MNHLSEIEAVAGTIPAKYKEVYDIFKTFYGENSISTSTDWKDNDTAITAYETWAKAVAALDADQFAFANYLYPGTGGFYFYNIGTSARSNVLPNIVTYEYNIIQDNETEAGKNPSQPSYRDYINYSFSNRTGTWQENQNGATYLAAYEEYLALVKSDRVAVAEKALDFVLELFEPYYDGLTDAVNSVVEVGQALINDRENADLDEIKATIDEYNNMDESIKGMATSLLGNSTLVLAATLTTSIEFNENTDATEAYNNQPRVNTYYGSQLVEQMNAYINEALLNDFIEYVNGVDMDALTDEIVAEAQSQYAQLSGDSKGAIPEETYNKFVQMVTPIKDTTDFSDEIAAFRPTAFVRPTNSKVAWTEGGIQNFVDSLENLLGGFVNIGDILSDNLYQVSVLKAVLGLYATLSHDTSEISASGLTFELGEVISWIVTPDTLAAQLEEEKFAGAVEKIGQIEVTEEEAAEGINEYDKLAAIDFTAEDWGFTDGDKDGFIDALLAVIRPITQLLDPDAQISFKAMGILTVTANIGLRMFDYQITDQGDYTAGIYENLLPLLEQLGLNDLPTTEEYKANYYEVKETSGAAVAADEFLRPILDSLFANIVDPLAAGQGGAIDPAGTVEVKQADSKTFTITADAGYTIDSLTVNGQAVAAAAGQTAYEYTVNGAEVTSADAVNMNTEDVTINVVFADEKGNPVDPVDPTDPTDPADPSDPSNPNGGNTNTGDNNNNNNGGKLPSVNNPNLPNTGAEVAGMSFITVIVALAVGAAVWFILRKRIVKD